MEERNKEMFSPCSDTKSESAESKHEHSLMFFYEVIIHCNLKYHTLQPNEGTERFELT